MTDVVVQEEKRTNGSLLKWLGTGITILVLLAGIIASWVTNKAAVAELQKDQSKIEERVEKTENKVHDIELNAVVTSSDIRTVKEDVAEIKKDVKKLLEK